MARKEKSSGVGVNNRHNPKHKKDRQLPRKAGGIGKLSWFLCVSLINIDPRTKIKCKIIDSLTIDQSFCIWTLSVSLDQIVFLMLPISSFLIIDPLFFIPHMFST